MEVEVEVGVEGGTRVVGETGGKKRFFNSKPL